MAILLANAMTQSAKQPQIMPFTQLYQLSFVTTDRTVTYIEPLQGDH